MRRSQLYPIVLAAAVAGTACGSGDTATSTDPPPSAGTAGGPDVAATTTEASPVASPAPASRQVTLVAEGAGDAVSVAWVVVSPTDSQDQVHENVALPISETVTAPVGAEVQLNVGPLTDPLAAVTCRILVDGVEVVADSDLPIVTCAHTIEPATGTTAAPPADSAPVTADVDAAAAAADEALAVLAESSAMAFAADVSAAGAASGEPPVGHLDVATTQDGVVMATGTLMGESIQLLTLDEQIFIVGPAGFWTRQGFDQPTADGFADRPVLFHPEQIAVDPAADLTPAAFAAELDAAIDAPETTIEVVAQPSGEPLYRFATPAGRVDIRGGDEPRLVGAHLASLAQSLPPTVDLGDVVISLLPEAVKPYAEMAKDVQGLFEMIRDIVMTGQRDVAIQLPASGGSCAPGGLCTVSTTVTNQVQSQYWELAYVMVTATATATGAGLGTQTCTVTVNVPPNGTMPASCLVNFAIPPSDKPRTYPIQSYFTVNAYWPVWTPNWEEINKLYREHTWEYLKTFYEEYYGS